MASMMGRRGEMTTDIRELSFISVQNIAELPYFWYSIQLKEASEPGELGKGVGKIANQLKRKHGCAIVADTVQVGLFSPISLNSGDSYEILREERINLAESRYRQAFFQVCNYQLLQVFRKAPSKPKIDIYSKRIYSKAVDILRGDKGDIEAQRYLTFNFAGNRDNHLILTLDFANEYHSQQTIDEIGLHTLKVGDRLLHTYDGKSCEFIGISTDTISTPLNSLGKKSLIEYHQQKYNTLPTNLDPNTPAIKVRYNNPQGKPFEADHVPQLLRKLFNRGDIDDKEWENQLLPIQKKAELSIETVLFINNKQFQLSQVSIQFEKNLRKPQPLIHLLDGQNNYNLDFGEGVFVYPSAGLSKGYLLEKPEQIKASILFPKTLEAETHTYLEQLRQQLDKFQIDFLRKWYTYDPLDSLNINNCCQEIKDCDIVIAVIPDSKEEDYHQEHNPYKRIKRQLIPRKIPSQMMTYQTVRKGWKSYIGNNLILGMNAKLGYMSWKLKQLKGKTQAFLGLDIGRKEGKAVGASAFLLSGEGQLLGWSNTELKASQETFDRESLRNLILDLFSFYQATYQQPLQHLVIHRDGNLIKEEYDLLLKLADDLKKHGLINLDVVEVIKLQSCRAVEVKQQENQIIYNKPDKGYIWEHCPHEALILTTGKRETKVSPNSSPRPLRIRKRMGDTDLMTLAEQVYWLSEIQVGSTQTIRLPITTYYAHRAAEYALDGLLPLGLQRDRYLWFL